MKTGPSLIAIDSVSNTSSDIDLASARLEELTENQYQ